MTNIKNFKFIEDLLNNFKNNDKKKFLLKTYCNITLKKYFQQYISLLSLKRRILIAEDYLHYCDNFKLKLPNKDSLNGYLWLHYNKKHYLKDFLESISSLHTLALQIRKIKAPILQRPRRSHQILQNRVINILQNPYDKHITLKYAFEAIIGYFHWILVPSNVFISIKNIKLKKENPSEHLLIMNNFKFYLPVRIIKTLELIDKIN